MTPHCVSEGCRWFDPKARDEWVTELCLEYAEQREQEETLDVDEEADTQPQIFAVTGRWGLDIPETD
jgi:hypothetical protein